MHAKFVASVTNNISIVLCTTKSKLRYRLKYHFVIKKKIVIKNIVMLISLNSIIIVQFSLIVDNFNLEK